MLNFKHLEIGNKGFTLIELVIGIALTGLLLSLSFNTFYFATGVSKDILLEDDFLLQGRFAIEYIRDEVIEAVEIISMDDYLPRNFSYTERLPFFIVKKEGNIYNHIFYRLADHTLYRTDFKSNIYCPIDMPNNGGHNFILDNIYDIQNTYYDKENMLLCIWIKTKNESNSKEYSFTETLYLKDDMPKGGLKWKERVLLHFLF